MATARDLLEQADALMRKNRERAVADIPVLIDAIEPPAIAPERALVAVPAAASVRAPGIVAASAPAAIDIPVLTDIVAAPVVAVVATAEKPPVVQPGFEGDPSNWLVMDTIDPATNSIAGGSDTLSGAPMFSNKAAGSAATPPPARSAPRPVAAPLVDEEDLPFIWDDPPPEVAAMPPMVDALMIEGLHRSVDASTVPTREEPSATAGEARDTVVLRPPDRAGVWLDHGPLQTGGERAPGNDARPAVTWEVPVAGSGLPSTAAQDDESALEIAAVEASADPASSASEAVASVGATATHAVANDDARWEALSEQISMQVLQRVDLFTDAGLRDQLAGRLRPIMARASAELVDTITGHVGQLLRTYVAEAIEREIAAWRRDQP